MGDQYRIFRPNLLNEGFPRGRSLCNRTVVEGSQVFLLMGRGRELTRKCVPVALEQDALL